VWFESPTAAVPPFAFVPFGGGARVYPGNEFARVETLVAVHYIVRRFRWKLAAGCDRSFSNLQIPAAFTHLRACSSTSSPFRNE
jgi:cytochrome P450